MRYFTHFRQAYCDILHILDKLIAIFYKKTRMAWIIPYLFIPHMLNIYQSQLQDCLRLYCFSFGKISVDDDGILNQLISSN